MISVEDEIKLRVETALTAFEAIILNSRAWTEAVSCADAITTANSIVDNAIKKSLNLGE